MFSYMGTDENCYVICKTYGFSCNFHIHILYILHEAFMKRYMQCINGLVVWACDFLFQYLRILIVVKISRISLSMQIVSHNSKVELVKHVFFRCAWRGIFLYSKKLVDSLTARIIDFLCMNLTDCSPSKQLVVFWKE